MSDVVKWFKTGRLRPAAVGLVALAVLLVAYFLFSPQDTEGSGAPDDAAPTSQTPEPTITEDAEEPEPTESAEVTPPGEPAPTSAYIEPEPGAGTPEPYTPMTTPAVPAGFVHVAIAEYKPEGQRIEVSAGAPAIATEDGACTLTAVHTDGTTLTAQQSAEFDGHGASCGLMSVSVAGQPTGEWQITISFTSPMGDAMSEPRTVVT